MKGSGKNMPLPVFTKGYGRLTEAMTARAARGNRDIRLRGEGLSVNREDRPPGLKNLVNTSDGYWNSLSSPTNSYVFIVHLLPFGTRYI